MARTAVLRKITLALEEAHRAGVGYRLPTEAEWEFACRAGTETVFWTGDSDEILRSSEWCGVNNRAVTHAVGELKANPLGLFDMHGTGMEWVQDAWGSDYYQQFQDKPAVDPTGAATEIVLRVYRGGRWITTGQTAVPRYGVPLNRRNRISCSDFEWHCPWPRSSRGSIHPQ